MQRSKEDARGSHFWSGSEQIDGWLTAIGVISSQLMKKPDRRCCLSCMRQRVGIDELEKQTTCKCRDNKRDKTSLQLAIAHIDIGVQISND